MEQIRFQTVITAGLLHDIGKFLQRGDFGPLNATGKHPQVSRDFIMSWREFFGKFCEAGGKAFTPLRYETKYVNVK